MDRGILDEVESDILHYEEFLQRGSPTTLPPLRSPRQQNQQDVQLHNRTGETRTDDRPPEHNFSEQLDRFIEEQSPLFASTPTSTADLPSENQEQEITEEKTIDSQESRDSTESDLGEIFDSLLSARHEINLIPIPINRDGSLPRNALSMKIHFSDFIDAALDQQQSQELNAVSPQQEWFDFKSGNYRTDEDGGPEEIVSSSYSHVGGSSHHDSQSVTQHSNQLNEDQRQPNRHSKEAVQKMVEEAMNQEFTFKPKLISKQRRSSSSISERIARLEHLSLPKMPKQIAIHESRNEITDAADLEECSFQPHIGRPPENRDNSKPVEERLYRAHDGKNATLARCLMKKEQETLMECTFHPITNSNRSKLQGYIPLQDRAMELQLARRERLNKQKEDTVVTPISTMYDSRIQEATFAPCINPRSKKIAADKERKKIKGMATMDGYCLISTMLDEEAIPSPAHTPPVQDKDCTFVPEINPISKRLSEWSKVPEDFIIRQQYFNELKRRKQLALQQETAERECTFVPKINDTEDILAASRFAGRLYEDREEFLDRLANADPESRNAKASIIRASCSEDCTFKPNLNAISKLIGRSRTVDELYEEGKKKRQMAIAEDDECDKQCTFKPSVKKPYPKHLKRPDADGCVEERLWKRAQDSADMAEKKKAEIRQREKRKELKECTFTPNIRYHVPKSKVISGPVEIPGLGRYLELRQNAQRMRENQRKREEEIFRLKCTLPRCKFTIPIPFNLTSTKGGNKLTNKGEKDTNKAIPVDDEPVQ